MVDADDDHGGCDCWHCGDGGRAVVDLFVGGLDVVFRVGDVCRRVVGNVYGLIWP